VFEELPPRPQAIVFALLGGGGDAPAFRGRTDDAGLEEEVEEARAHFRSKLQSSE
jgi:hypothetical protein